MPSASTVRLTGFRVKCQSGKETRENTNEGIKRHRDAIGRQGANEHGYPLTMDCDYADWGLAEATNSRFRDSAGSVNVTAELPH